MEYSTLPHSLLSLSILPDFYSGVKKKISAKIWTKSVHVFVDKAEGTC